jgi:acyl carrier protein
MKEESLARLKAVVRIVLEVPDGVDIEGVRKVNSRRWDSLAQVSLVAAIESEFSVVIPPRDYERLTSFKSITFLLEELGI